MVTWSQGTKVFCLAHTGCWSLHILYSRFQTIFREMTINLGGWWGGCRICESDLWKQSHILCDWSCYPQCLPQQHHCLGHGNNCSCTWRYSSCENLDLEAWPLNLFKSFNPLVFLSPEIRIFSMASPFFPPTWKTLGVQTCTRWESCPAGCQETWSQSHLRKALFWTCAKRHWGEGGWRRKPPELPATVQEGVQEEAPFVLGHEKMNKCIFSSSKDVSRGRTLPTDGLIGIHT